MGLIKSSNVPLTTSPFSMSDIESTAKGMLLRGEVEGRATAHGVSRGRSRNFEEPKAESVARAG